MARAGRHGSGPTGPRRRCSWRQSRGPLREAGVARLRHTWGHAGCDKPPLGPLFVCCAPQCGHGARPGALPQAPASVSPSSLRPLELVLSYPMLLTRLGHHCHQDETAMTRN